MTPKKYIECIKENNFQSGIFKCLNKKEIQDSLEVLSVSLDYVGDKVEQISNDVGPKEERIISVLSGFIATFVQHANDLDLVKEISDGYL